MAARKPPATALVRWEDKLAAEADIAAGMEASAAGGTFFSFRGGVMTYQDAPLPDNEMAVVILDHVMENVWYEGAFDPDNPSNPSCFAFGRVEPDLVPHQVVVEAGLNPAHGCHGCPMNEWGSANTGRGKACRNTRRLALIPAGTITKGQFTLFDDFESAPIGYMKLPLTSVKGYASFVTQLAGALRRPPYGVVTRVRVVPDPKTQFRVLFEPIMALPDEAMEVICKRHDEAVAAIEFPYAIFEAEAVPPPPPPKTRGRATPTPTPTMTATAKGARARKY
jgi:hypothetical protein